MTHPTSLRPREHGAYAMLAFPLLSGLWIGGASPPGLAFAVLAVTAFLAHEPALVVLGGRGERLRIAHRSAARRRLGGLGAAGLVAGTLFAILAPASAWPAALTTGGLGVVVAGLVLTGWARTPVGELLVAATFASLHGAVAAAGGGSAREVYLPVAAWTVSFVLATLAVHSVKFRFKGRGPGGWTVATAPLVALATILAGAIALRSGHPWWGGIAAVLPKSAVVLALAGLSIHPRHLRRLGWALVVTDTVTLILLTALVG